MLRTQPPTPRGGCFHVRCMRPVRRIPGPATTESPHSSFTGEQLLQAILEAKGDKKLAAKNLGIGRRSLYRQLLRLGMSELIAARPQKKPFTPQVPLTGAGTVHPSYQGGTEE